MNPKTIEAKKTYIPRRFTSAKKVKVQNARIPTARKGMSARIESSLNQESISHAKFSRERNLTRITSSLGSRFVKTKEGSSGGI